MIEFGKYLKSIRLKQNLSQARLAELTDISTWKIICFEYGRKIPTTLEKEKLSKILKDTLLLKI